MLKSLLKRIEELDSDIEVTRERLLQSLWMVLDFALNKLLTKQASAKNKPAWARVAVSAASAAGAILKDDEMDDILDRLEALEEAQKR